MRQKRRLSQTVLIISVVAALLLTAQVWTPLERKAYDLRFRVAAFLGMGTSRPTGNVVVVGIDEQRMLREKPALFLYPDIGNFLKKMQDAGASVIAIDIIPVHEQREKFANAVKGLVSAGDQSDRYAAELGERLDRSLLEPVITVSAKTPIVQAFSGELVPYYYGASAFMKQMHLADVVLTDGNTRDNDGVIRRQELISQGENTFGPAIYHVLTGRDVPENSIRLNYFLRKNIPFFCFDNVMNNDVSTETFRGKAVILGYVSGIEDVHPTPVIDYRLPPCFSGGGDGTNQAQGTRLPGLLVQAIVAETLLTNTPPQEIPLSFQYLILLCMSALGIAIALTFRPQAGLPLTLILMAVSSLVNVYFFSKGHVIRVFPDLISPLLIQACLYPYKYVVEERTRLKLYKLFGSYIDREVIDALLDKDPSQLFRGDAKQVCILFLDIRDFTKLSLSSSPENIVRFLNLFFGRVTQIVKRNNGFVNKFIGDGILAFFPAGGNMVSDALRASQEILLETERLNTEGVLRPYTGDYSLRIGIGVHFGTVVLGNVGSEEKMDFTIIGEHVNIASRIEGLTKQLNRPLLVSGAAHKMVNEGFSFEYLGEFVVKGVDRPVAIYTLT